MRTSVVLLSSSVSLISSRLYASQQTETAMPITVPPPAQVTDVAMPDLRLDYSTVVYQVYSLQATTLVLFFALILMVFFLSKWLKKSPIDLGVLSCLCGLAIGVALLVLRVKLA